MKWNDPIVMEVHKTRERLFKDFGYDLEKVLEKVLLPVIFKT